MSRQARITTAAAEVAAALARAADPAAGVVVKRAYAPDWLAPDYWLNNPNLVNRFTGRRLYVFGSAERGTTATRGEDFNDYDVSVLVLERYTGPEAEVPDAWVDERVAWVEAAVYDRLGDARTDDEIVGGAVPWAVEWTQVFDADLLRQLKLFCSEVTATFRRAE